MSNGMQQHIRIVQATTLEQVAQIRLLFEEYAEWLGIDLSFQGFSGELEALPGAYAPPDGRLLLAMVNDDAAGCMALRPLEAGICEMKRLFVRPHFRGLGLGRLLSERIVEDARAIGYDRMRLDTLPVMQGAISLYEELGFLRRAAYYDTPLTDTIFMELEL